ncbi:MAG: DMT family transporter [Gallintestinimicrobium sp.]
MICLFHAVIIHVIGTVFSLIVCLCRHQKILVKAEAPWMYLGGAIGVFTTLAIICLMDGSSMTSIVALVLFGQTVISLLIDSFGLMGMEKHPFKKTSVIGLVFAPGRYACHASAIRRRK